MSAPERLSLGDARPFAVGGRRWCFVDPRDPHRCVKVNRTDDLRYGRTQPGLVLPARWRRAYDNNLDEHRALAALMRRIGADAFDHLPRTHGWVDTDLGRGLVIDLVRDDDGSISRTLREHICAGADATAFERAIDEFGDYLLRHRVMTRALLDHNLVAQRRDDHWRLFLVDGMGDKAWLPVAAWIPRFASASVARRLVDFRRRLAELAASPTPPDQWDTSRWSQGFLDRGGDDRPER